MELLTISYFEYQAKCVWIHRGLLKGKGKPDSLASERAFHILNLKIQT